MNKQKITPFLMFTGNANAAVKFYTSVFENAEINDMKYYGVNEQGIEGTVKVATFSICGQQFMCIDSNFQHGFGFTPSISFYITCPTENEVDELFEKLSKDGKILMALGVYPFSKKYGWVADQFGVSWQVSLGE